MAEVETARHNEPWRKEFFYVRDLMERGRKAGREEQLAADQARIAELEAEVEALRAQKEARSVERASLTASGRGARQTLPIPLTATC